MTDEELEELIDFSELVYGNIVVLKNCEVVELTTREMDRLLILMNEKEKEDF